MSVYEKLIGFKRKYPSTVAWRIKKHALVVDKHLNPDEKVLYAFVGQSNDVWYNLYSTAVYVITNKRLIVATSRVFYGYYFYSVTPDMFNDLKVYSGLFWGRVEIDTIKEFITITNVSKGALEEIESNITKYIMKEKKRYVKRSAND